MFAHPWSATFLLVLAAAKKIRYDLCEPIVGGTPGVYVKLFQSEQQSNAYWAEGLAITPSSEIHDSENDLHYLNFVLPPPDATFHSGYTLEVRSFYRARVSRTTNFSVVSDARAMVNYTEGISCYSHRKSSANNFENEFPFAIDVSSRMNVNQKSIKTTVKKNSFYPMKLRMFDLVSDAYLTFEIRDKRKTLMTRINITVTIGAPDSEVNFNFAKGFITTTSFWDESKTSTTTNVAPATDTAIVSIPEFITTTTVADIQDPYTIAPIFDGAESDIEIITEAVHTILEPDFEKIFEDQNLQNELIKLDPNSTNLNRKGREAGMLDSEKKMERQGSEEEIAIAITSIEHSNSSDNLKVSMTLDDISSLSEKNENRSVSIPTLVDLSTVKLQNGTTSEFEIEISPQVLPTLSLRNESITFPSNNSTLSEVFANTSSIQNLSVLQLAAIQPQPEIKSVLESNSSFFPAQSMRNLSRSPAPQNNRTKKKCPFQSRPVRDVSVKLQELDATIENRSIFLVEPLVLQNGYLNVSQPNITNSAFVSELNGKVEFATDTLKIERANSSELLLGASGISQTDSNYTTVCSCNVPDVHLPHLTNEPSTYSLTPECQKKILKNLAMQRTSFNFSNSGPSESQVSEFKNETYDAEILDLKGIRGQTAKDDTSFSKLQRLVNNSSETLSIDLSPSDFPQALETRIIEHHKQCDSGKLCRSESGAEWYFRNSSMTRNSQISEISLVERPSELVLSGNSSAFSVYSAPRTLTEVYAVSKHFSLDLSSEYLQESVSANSEIFDGIYGTFNMDMVPSASAKLTSGDDSSVFVEKMTLCAENTCVDSTTKLFMAHSSLSTRDSDTETKQHHSNSAVFQTISAPSISFGDVATRTLASGLSIVLALFVSFV